MSDAPPAPASPPPPRRRSALHRDDPRLRARVRARVLEARRADWRPWALSFGLGGAFMGSAFVGIDGRGWKAVPVLAVLGALSGLALWASVRKAEPPKPRPPARRQTFGEQLIDLGLLLLVAPLALAAIALAVWGRSRC